MRCDCAAHKFNHSWCCSLVWFLVLTSVGVEIRVRGHPPFSNSIEYSPAIFVCPPEGGACSSWIKHGFSHSLRQRLRGVTGKWFERVG
jgi:hypothetical protein